MQKPAPFYLIILLFTLTSAYSQPIIIDHNCSQLEPIPEWAILQARDSLHIAYGHTSHGSQLTEGMTSLAQQDTNLIGYKDDIYCWGYNTPGCLDLHDYFKPGDLGHVGDTGWEIYTRDYLENNPNASDINVIMWSWCGGCSDNTVKGIQIYLDTMNALEIDYPDINFVYMTGHKDIWNDDTLKRNNQLIRDYCIANNKILFDFADIESYDPDGNYYEYANDNCAYYDENNNYLGNWATEWQDSHTEGEDWYNCYAAHSEPLNGNMKAYASWWLWCRLAGWDGTSGSNDFRLDLTVLLEGPINGSEMNTDLNILGLIPLEQPYSVAPWNYLGDETVASIPNTNIVDWILIELRDALSPEQANNETTISRQAGFILKNGSVVSLDGISDMQFNADPTQNLYAVIIQRNHLSIISNYALTLSEGTYTYDFTTDAFQAYGASPPQKEIATGVYGMFGGDLNCDGNIDAMDKTIWISSAGLQQSYSTEDANMDCEIDNQDKNDIILQNMNEESYVPE